MKDKCIALLLLVFAPFSLVAQTTIQKAPAPVIAPKAIDTVYRMPEMPDVTVQGFGFGNPQTNGFRTAHVTVTNVGLAGAGFKASQRMAVLSIGKKSYTCFAPAGGYYIAPRATAELKTTMSTTPGTYAATWTVNPDRIPAERFFENNTTAFQAVLSPP